ncbi:S1 family peptidase [Paraliomyxa miuraensis]|uniref:S1 family peptidase n=1 Tax=Paraliomyxa miuraensis TaxID=376150 RepID=UPI0022544359|nr:S1 family peptidase [Paraliomyxa miuraensis]MCX4246122.1 S1 family peptidase [Paraliomyxa miuraensis]
MLPSIISVALVLAGASGLAPAADRSAIANGNAAMECQWPTVVSFRANEDKCTGILVHPRVIVTAAHCVEHSPAGAIRFGEESQPAAFIVDAERCGFDPEFARTRAPSSDVGYCVLEEAVEDIPPTPLLMGCETAWLHQGMPAVIVGFGITPTNDLFGTKRYAFTVLDSELRSDGTVWVGDQEVNACLGDSGGPAFVQSPAGTWHMAGVLTHGPECGEGPMLYRSLYDRIAWLETETGFDLSPCHAATGEWAPGPECESIAAAPLAHGPSWAEHCAGELAAAPECPAVDATTGEDGSSESGSSTEADTQADGPREPDGCGCRAHHEPRGAPAWLLGLLGLARLSRRSPWPRRPWSPRPRPRCPG